MGPMIGTGFTDRYLSAEETRRIVREGLESLRPEGKRLLFIIPDGTRTMPMPAMFALFREALQGRAKQVDYLVALGTHQPMSDEALSKLVGVPVVGGRAGDSRVFNHLWSDPATFATLGEIPAAEIEALSGGRLSQSGAGVAQPDDLRLRPARDLRAGLPARGRRLLGRQQVLLPGHRRARDHQLHPLARRADHQLRRDRRRLHARARRDRPRRVAGVRAHRVLRAGGDAGRARRAVLRLGARGLGAGLRALGATAHRLARQAGQARAVGDAADVRGPVDRRQGDVQDRARGRRRRRGGDLRPAHQGGELHPRPPHRRHRLPLPRLLHRAAGALRAVPRRRARALDARQGAGAPTTRRPAWRRPASP